MSALDALLRHTGDEAVIPAEAAPLLSALTAHDDWLPDLYAQPSPQRYQQYLLYADPDGRFSVVSFVWGPGQSTPIHDHTVWGLVSVLRGAEISQQFGQDSHGHWVPTTEPLRMEVGAVDAVSPAIGDVHRVANALPDRPSISIHITGPTSAPCAATSSNPTAPSRNSSPATATRRMHMTVLAIDQAHLGHQGDRRRRVRRRRRTPPRCRCIPATSTAARSNRIPPNCSSRCSTPAAPRSPRRAGRSRRPHLANQGETVLAWDRATGAPLSTAIVWQDRRAETLCAGLAGHAEALAARTGLVLDPYFAPKMAWLRRNGETGGVVTTSDTWLLHQLTGAFVTDATTASRSLLVELGATDWDPELLSLFGLDGEEPFGDRLETTR